MAILSLSLNFRLLLFQVWCGSSRPEAAKNKLKIAVHSPGRFRYIYLLLDETFVIVDNNTFQSHRSAK